jgi:hypothetical protein
VLSFEEATVTNEAEQTLMKIQNKHTGYLATLLNSEGAV